ncbi:MAG: hypothetical protein HQL11_05695 [Candidatus Omnitrophica bacterium]|nr:hypothetical protein [Candidatus Omnitrophota bacterium]
MKFATKCVWITLAGVLLVAATVRAQEAGNWPGFKAQIAICGARALMFAEDLAEAVASASDEDRFVLNTLEEWQDEIIRYVNATLMMTELSEIGGQKPRAVEILRLWSGTGFDLVTMRARNLSVFGRFGGLEPQTREMIAGMERMLEDLRAPLGVWSGREAAE